VSNKKVSQDMMHRGIRLVNHFYSTSEKSASIFEYCVEETPTKDAIDHARNKSDRGLHYSVQRAKPGN
jgi:hypothetical protein